MRSLLTGTNATGILQLGFPLRILLKADCHDIFRNRQSR